MTMKNGIHIESEFKQFQDKATKFDKIVSLAREEKECRARIKSIAQERVKIIGIDTESYYMKGKRE